MKKVLLLFSVFSLAATTAFSQDNQDNQYYTGDENTVVQKAPDAPPPIPTYVQPPCPGEGYLWEPGYWAWGADGYYWVPGVWVLPPQPGLFWTPGYWGFYGGYYGWHHGYWGPTVGYYGGIDYGFGYFGVGFYGGRWEGGHFIYNTAVWHVGPGFHHVYVDRGFHDPGIHASFNGPRGVHYRPAAGEIAAMHAANHIQRTNEQVSHEAAMSKERGQFARTNHGSPAVHSMGRPGGQRFDNRGHAVGGGHGGGGRR